MAFSLQLEMAKRWQKQETIYLSISTTILESQTVLVPSYQHFRCPTTLPESWATESLHIEPTSMDDVGSRDQICRVTASELANVIAHIIPQAQSEWWQRNIMFMYTANPDLSSDTRCAENAILLRRVYKLLLTHGNLRGG
ncbi:hypothetical protein A9K55_006374 [Cordyceps militaris]|uniref:HNH nuclease domain-containing protein n=1 Tax=Cordyceps militaris TaxID=73501 RepID=A0A2H4SCJ6_CORMI|nr:hypothetical protein A9K55_006374 [Cordyceps militaris]